MCKVIQFFLAIGLFLLVAMVGMSYAQVSTGGFETCCPPVVTCPEVKVECTFPNPPVINCPEVNVKCECPITTECPAINAICEVGAIGLPGLWRLSIGGRTSCGTIEVVGSGFLLTDAREGKADYFLINVLKKARQVESCE